MCDFHGNVIGGGGRGMAASMNKGCEDGETDPFIESIDTEAQVRMHKLYKICGFSTGRVGLEVDWYLMVCLDISHIILYKHA
jgi:hypothetical protein